MKKNNCSRKVREVRPTHTNEKKIEESMVMEDCELVNECRENNIEKNTFLFEIVVEVKDKIQNMDLEFAADGVLLEEIEEVVARGDKQDIATI